MPSARLLCKICSKTFPLDLEVFKEIIITLCEDCVEKEAARILRQRAFYRGGRSLNSIEMEDL